MAKDFGPFVFGGNVLGWTADRETSFRLLDAFIEGGGKSIDSADSYSAWVPGNQGGDSETIIGEWLASRKNRDQVHIATKVGMWDKYPGLSAKNIRAAVEGSLRRLQTDYIDLYYAHQDDEDTPQEEYVRAFDELVREGKVRALGVSNFSPQRLESALKIAKDGGLSAFSVSQDHWNLVERDIENTLVPVLQKHGLVELPYFGLASGFLTGKYRPGAKVDSQRAGGAARYLEVPKNLEILKAMDVIAERHQVSHAAVALAWLGAQNPVGAPIASARTLEQLKGLFDVQRLTLSAEELQSLA